MFDQILCVGTFEDDDLDTLDRFLRPLEKLVVDFAHTDPSKGMAWTGDKSRCWWTTDGRRVTLCLHDLGGGGHTIRISAGRDPYLDRDEKEEAA